MSSGDIFDHETSVLESALALSESENASQAEKILDIIFVSLNLGKELLFWSDKPLTAARPDPTNVNH